MKSARADQPSREAESNGYGVLSEGQNDSPIERWKSTDPRVWPFPAFPSGEQPRRSFRGVPFTTRPRSLSFAPVGNTRRFAPTGTPAGSFRQEPPIMIPQPWESAAPSDTSEPIPLEADYPSRRSTNDVPKISPPKQQPTVDAESATPDRTDQPVNRSALQTDDSPQHSAPFNFTALLRRRQRRTTAPSVPARSNEAAAGNSHIPVKSLNRQRIPSRLPVVRNPQSPRGARSLSLALIGRNADQHTEYAFALAEKGAVHSARAEFIKALSTIVFALDAQGPAIHRRALAAGFRAIDEAGQFLPRSDALDDEIDLDALIRVHKTPVLKQADHTRLTPLAAMQAYYTYAGEQLLIAGGRQPAASRALYGLGRIQPYLRDDGNPSRSLPGPTTIVFHRAALSIDGDNHLAANELGVQLAGYGRFDEAQSLFRFSLSIQPTTEAWHNLSRVCEERGEWPAARRARENRDKMIAVHAQPAQAPHTGTAIRWVDAVKFSSVAVSTGIAAPAGFQTERRKRAAATQASAGNNRGAATGKGWLRIGALFPWNRHR
jgi:tetratricopeptide (TPR) repeat protein